MTQNEALDILKTGANVFLTGEPGSGKTHTVNQYVAWLRERGIEPSITASTGIAATHIGGFTIHSWSGIGIKRRLDQYELDKIASNKRVYQRVSGARILIIDEVSMLSDKTLGMVDAVCREIRRNSEPFGGLQIIFVGDFFQLPPINKRERNEEDGHEITQESFIEENTPLQFAFASPSWQKAQPLVCYLSEQHRQEDAEFLNFLTAVRRGEVEEMHMVLLRKRYSKFPKDDITQLYSHNADVDNLNFAELSKLPEQEKVFEMESAGPEHLVASLKRGCLSPQSLLLKVGARVMFTKNDTIMWKFANGTLGTVTGFVRESGMPLVKIKGGKTIAIEPMDWNLEDGGRILATVTQIPLRLAWAMTVHKSQGMSLDSAHMDLSSTFEYGQGYVALSRVRTLEGLSLAGLNARALQVHPEILEKDEEFRAAAAAAREKFAILDPAELTKFHHNFLRACGGSLEPIFGGKKKKVAKSKKIPTYEITKALLSRQLSLSEMAKERGMTIGTIMAHLEKLKDKGELKPEKDCAHLRPLPSRLQKISKAFKTAGKKDGEHLLTPAHDILGESFSFEEIRLARLFL